MQPVQQEFMLPPVLSLPPSRASSFPLDLAARSWLGLTGQSKANSLEEVASSRGPQCCFLPVCGISFSFRVSGLMQIPSLAKYR